MKDPGKRGALTRGLTISAAVSAGGVWGHKTLTTTWPNGNGALMFRRGSRQT